MTVSKRTAPPGATPCGARGAAGGEARGASEEQLRHILENVTDVVWTSDLALGITSATPSAERVFGRAPAEWGRLRPEQFISPRSLPRVREFIAAELARAREAAAPRTVTLEIEHLRDDGSSFWAEVTARFLRDADGRPVGIIGVTRDISERRAAEQARRESEDCLRAVLERIPDAIFIADGGGRFVDANQAALEQLGYSREELLGRGVQDIVAPQYRERALRRVAAGEAPQGFSESRHLRSDGSEVPVEVALLRISVGGRACTLGVARDISERLRTEQERRSLEEQLAQAQRIESVGRLAGGVAHDFNNMLSPILGYAELLREEIRPGDPRRARVSAILESAERCRDLVRRLLAFARKQTLEVRPLDLNEVVRGFEGILRRTLREHIALEIRAARRLGTALGDPRQIEQVLLNLAVNAQDAMPGGGRIVVETADVLLDEAYARSHEYVRPGPHVMLAVRDTGTGMDRRTLQRVFEPFFTTKEVGQGTGLGLAVVYGIVKQHGGSIEVESLPGAGSTFRVFFPHAGGEVAAAPAPGAPRTLCGTETVLVVEDDLQVRRLVAEVLRGAGYTVLEAGSAAQAHEVAERGGDIDLLFTDVVLVDGNGREVHERLAAAGSRHRLLYMSGYPAEVVGSQGILDQGLRLARKPFSVRQLLEQVRDALGS